MRGRSSLLHWGPTREKRPRRAFETSSSAPRRMHTKTVALGKVCTAEGAHEAAPMALPLGLVAMRQPTQMNSQRLTWASPLLQSTLSLGLGGPSTATAARGQMVKPQHMLSMPVVIRSLRSWLPCRALGAMATLQPWGRTASEFG